MTRLDRITERLNLKEFQLRALLEVTKAINNNLQREELLKLYASIMHDELGITRLMLFENGAGWRCAHSYGADESQQQMDVGPLMDRYKDIQFVGSSDEGLISGFDIAVPVFHRDLPLALLLIGDIDEEERRVSPAVKHMNFIQTLTNLIAVALENKRLGKLALQQERDKRELELAADMQTMLIPRDLPNDEAVQAAAWYLPHRQVGGDYYDLIRIDAHQLVMCVADVSGKGMAAALLMSNFQATLRAMLLLGYTQLDKLVVDLNELVMERARGERFITLFIGTVDTHAGTIRYVNAGHNAPILWRHGQLSELKDGCIALGMLDELPFVHVGSAPISEGMLLSYTDGLVEQEDVYGAAFETAPLERALQQFSGAGPNAVNEALISNFEAHRAGLPYLDDIALLTCRFA
jgi:phosphoserine phosphatase RsbU/P